MPTLLSSTSMRPWALRQAATMASTSAPRETSAVNAVALPPSPVTIFTVSSAAAALRSTQNTCAPSRAKVTAVALPLPQPGPIEPAPTTIAVLPLSRSIEFSLDDDVAEITVARMEPLRNPGLLVGVFPDCAEPVIGRRFAPTRWLHPGY